jgi:antitoxin (DNA-binding transcriptional repressor) of toxin-antitoxin stability system
LLSFTHGFSRVPLSNCALLELLNADILIIMGEHAIPVDEAAANFPRLLELIESRGEPTTLLRNGKAVARLIPWTSPANTCAELAERWEKIEKLPADEAEAFAKDVEQARDRMPALKPAWD